MKALRLTRWHLVLWLGLAVAAAGIAVNACLRYNEVAGTDKSPAHIAAIAFAVLAGPLVGPVANPDAAAPFTMPPAVLVATLLLLSVQVLSLAPFRLIKHSVSIAWFVAAWAGFIVAAVAWFTAALISLGYFLS